MSVVTERNAWLALLDAGVWAGWSAAAGYAAHKIPVARLQRDAGLLRLTRAERDPSFYERRLRIKRWKDVLPEAGTLFAGGFSKRHVARRDREYLERFIVETRRAELTHWLVMGATPFFFLWNPWWLALVMAGYGLIANVPCIIIQRYNRARLSRMLARVTASP